MPNIFDLSNIAKVVEREHPARILVVDTNVLMNECDFGKWTVMADGKTLFVLSDRVSIEMQFLVERAKKSGKSTESSDKAYRAMVQVNGLLHQGDISVGIPTNGGWFISVPSPKGRDLDLELEQLKDIVDAFGRSDTTMLLLTRECHELFVTTPVTLLTGETNLFNIVQMQGLPCHHCSGFPVTGLKEAAAVTKLMDWDQVLEDIQSDTKQNAVVVNLTLTSLRQGVPDNVSTGEVNLGAEGYGMISRGAEKWPFLWAVDSLSEDDSLAYIYEVALNMEDQGDSWKEWLRLNFMGEHEPGQDILAEIASYFAETLLFSPYNTEGEPTLRDRESVMEAVLESQFTDEHIFELLKPLEAFEDLDEWFAHVRELSKEAVAMFADEMDKLGGVTNFCIEYISNQSDDKRTAFLTTLFQAMGNCWKIGQTYRFSILPDKKQEAE